MKQPLLFLCHRIPYPPDKGDKIRSWNLLAHLSQHYRVFLGAFVDDPEDFQYRAKLAAVCEACHLVPISPAWARIRSLTGLAVGQPLTLPFYSSGSMQRWVTTTVEQQAIARIFVFSSAMAQFVCGARFAALRRVVDFVDVDSDKWRQYGESTRGPKAWLYRREASRLLDYERAVHNQFDASLFVSDAEARLFRQQVTSKHERVGFFNNGVDADYFAPGTDHACPFAAHERAFVFTGAMDYWPNIDAVVWFARQIFPRIFAACKDARFYIVGGKPADSVRALANSPGVHVTGRVPDVRPYLQHATAVVAPMRIARGVQNKVLEAMAMAKPVIVSPQGLEGIQAEPGAEVLLAEQDADYLRYARALLDGEFTALGAGARARVLKDFNWTENLERISVLIG